MVCWKCSAAADLAEAARTLDLSEDVWVTQVTGIVWEVQAMEPGTTVGTVIDRAVERLHNECPRGTRCVCQHRRRTQPTTLITGTGGRTMCTCHGPELPHRPHLCAVIGARIAVDAARAAVRAAGR